MNDVIDVDESFDGDLEVRVRAAMHALADTHTPASTASPGADGERRGSPSWRPWLLAAAAVALIAVGVGALIAVNSDDGDEPLVASPPATEPAAQSDAESDAESEQPGDLSPATTIPPPTPPASTLPPSNTPNAAGDMAIDPDALRFPAPLPDDVVAFLNAPDDLLPPVVEPPLTVTDEAHAEPAESLRFVAMDGPRRLMSAIVSDGVDDIQVTGAAVDVGVDGARYVDADEGAIVIPVDDGLRIVAPTAYFSFGGGGPHVEPEILVETARSIGTLPMVEVAELEGLVVNWGTIDGATVNPIGVGEVPKVRHGGGQSPSATVYRLAEPPSAIELIGLVYALAREPQELRNTPAVGDVAFWPTPSGYIELVSPVDLLVVGYGTDVDRLETIDFVLIDDLDTAFDGTVEAPPPARGIEEP